jgi:MFS family permease
LTINKTDKNNINKFYLSSFFYSIGAAIVPLGTTINYFVSSMGMSKVFIALLNALALSLMRFPQFFMAKKIKESKNPFPIYISVLFTKTLIYFLIGITVLLSSNDTFTIVAFYILYSIYSISSGITNVYRVEINGNMIPKEILGHVYGYNASIANIGQLIGSGIIATLPIFFGVPKFYGLLFIIMGVFSLICSLFLASIKYTHENTHCIHLTFKEYFKMCMTTLKEDTELIKFITTKIFSMLGTVIFTFLVIYANDTIGVNLKSIFFINILYVISKIIASVFWGYIDDLHTWKFSYFFGRLLHILNLILLISFKNIEIFYIAFILKGITESCFQVGTEKAYIDLGGENKSLYTGIINLVTFPVVLTATIAVGYIIDTLGYNFTFYMSIFFLILSILGLFTHKKVSTN